MFRPISLDALSKLDLCPACSEMYRPMYKVSVSRSGHITPWVCERKRHYLDYWISKISLCGVFAVPEHYFITHQYFRELPFILLVLDRYPDISGKPWYDIPDIDELVLEYLLIRPDRPQEEHILGRLPE
jgi:hypothetical protein